MFALTHSSLLGSPIVSLVHRVGDLHTLIREQQFFISSQVFNWSFLSNVDLEVSKYRAFVTIPITGTIPDSTCDRIRLI